MNSNLSSYTSLSHLTLPRSSFMEAMLNAALKYHIIDKSAVTHLQASIVDQLVICIKGYTGEQSSSVSIETAGELSAGLAYTLNEYLYSLNDHDKALSMLLSRPFNEIWLDGIRLTKSKIARAMYLCRIASSDRCDIPSPSYNRALDTDIRESIMRYDAYYKPHFSCRTFEYPTALDEKLEGRGIDFTINYLSALICENRFCRLYSSSQLNALFNQCRETEPFNFYTSLLLNAVMLRFLRRDNSTLLLSIGDIEQAEELLADFSDEEIRAALIRSCDSLDDNEQAYRRRVLESHLRRILTAIGNRSLRNMLIIA